MYYRIRIRETDTGLWGVSVAEIVLGEHGVKERDLPEGAVFDKPSPVEAVREMIWQLGWWGAIGWEIVLAAAEDRVAITVPAARGGGRPGMVLCPRLEPAGGAG